jgi:cobalt-zinc-cadmium efflux system membrane fusion protein
VNLTGKSLFLKKAQPYFMRYLVFCALIFSALVFLNSCHSHEHDEEGGHSHGDSGHDHEEEHGHAHGEEEAHLPTEKHTVWTDSAELYVEFPALVSSKSSQFAAHFTWLDKHQAVQSGEMTITLEQGGKQVIAKTESPTSPGIFLVSLSPESAGYFKLTFSLESEGKSEQMILDNVLVYESEAQASAIEEAEESGSISLLKEQAWKMDFQTEQVVKGAIYDVIPTSGIWKVSPTDFKSLASTNSGEVSFSKINFTEGYKVRKGQLLMTISNTDFTSNNLSAELAKAKADLEQAEADYLRKGKLLKDGVIAITEFEISSQNYKVATTNFQTLSNGYSNGGKQVIAPFAGYIDEIYVDNGDFVEEGAELISLVRDQSSVLEVQVSPSERNAVRNIKDIWYQAKIGVWSSLNDTNGKIISTGKAVDAENPLISVFASVNELVDMPAGSFTEVQLISGNASEELMIPESSLLEDYGAYSVIVQTGGESFERRPVKLGRRNGTNVAILSGLILDERVVTRGVYQVKMASNSSQVPDHGHAH